jgi:NDP-sugar pyrophosphorylase family protein
MLEVGDKPMLEHIIDGLKKHGLNNFYLAVNYKAEIFEEYFKDGADFDCSIQYLKEEKRLGTAGPISLLPNTINEPFIVMNGDLLSNIDFSELLDFNIEKQSVVTMCVKEYEVQIPYGVIKVDQGFAKSFTEKPLEKYQVNAGVYVFSHKLIPKVPTDAYFDMSTFLNNLLSENIYPLCFDLSHNWIDIGKESELIKARELFSKKK